jgi:hypothetical protein
MHNPLDEGKKRFTKSSQEVVKTMMHRRDNPNEKKNPFWWKYFQRAYFSRAYIPERTIQSKSDDWKTIETFGKGFLHGNGRESRQ